MISLDEIRENTKTAVESLLEMANLEPGQVFVIGCSTSEIVENILARPVVRKWLMLPDGVLPLLEEKGSTLPPML